MKKLNYILSAAVLVFLLANAGCKGDDDPGVPASDTVGAKFAGAYTPTNVTFESDDRSADYTDFTLTINFTAGALGGSYSISGGPVELRPFPESGTWEYAGTIADPAAATFVVLRNDGVEMTVSGLTGTGFNLDFNLPPGSAGTSTSKLDAVEGDWSFTF
jgi:hypothetical protein